MALSKNSKIEVADINAISSTANSALSTANTANTNATNAYNLANSKQNALGFIPVQQGGGIGQGTNKVYIGWSGSQLKCTVDQTDIGAFSFGSAISYPQVQKSTVSNKRVYAPSGGTWFCFGEWGYTLNSEDSVTRFVIVNGVSGGGVIVSQTGNSYSGHWSDIYCIRTA